MFRNRKSAGTATYVGKLDQSRCEWIRSLPWGKSPDHSNSPAKKKKAVDGAKILLDIAKESSDWFPPLKSALGGVCALVKHYEVIG